jgi:hypothetical protein
VKGYLPNPAKTTLWLIEWELNGEVYSNHYLAFTPPVDLEHYLNYKIN